MRSILIAAVSVALMAPVLADPQTADMSPVPTLHAETRVVQIDVIVKDAHGKPVTELTKSDFTVTDNGKPRKIDIFSINRGSGDDKPTEATVAAPIAPKQSLAANVFSNRNQRPPNIPGHSTVIVLDQVNAFFEDAGQGRRSVLDLMTKVPPDERMALYVVARKQGLVVVQDYTTDRELLLRNLGKYVPRGLMPRPFRWPTGIQDRPGAPEPPGLPPSRLDPPAQEAEFQWHDNSEQARLSLQALAEHLSLVPGRKSVYLVTQGFPARLMRGMGQPAWDKTLSALNEANVAVNTVDSRGLLTNGIPQDPFNGTITAMQQIAEGTGGKAYFGRNDLDAAMAEGIEASRTTYTLAFYLADNERDNQFHSLKVKVDRAGLELFHRQGYYAGETELPATYDKTSKGDLEASLLNQVNATGIGITARVDAVPGTPRGKLDIRLNLDPATLSLTAKDGGWTGKVEETLIEQNASGNTLSKLTDVREFEVTQAKRASFDRDGAGWPLSMPLAPGVTKLTIVVRDSKSGHVGSLTVPLK